MISETIIKARATNDLKEQIARQAARDGIDVSKALRLLAVAYAAGRIRIEQLVRIEETNDRNES